MTSKFSVYGIVDHIEEDQWGLKISIKTSGMFPIVVRVSKKTSKMIEKVREELALKSEGMFEGGIYGSKSKIPSLMLTSYTLRTELLEGDKKEYRDESNNGSNSNPNRRGGFYNNRFKKGEDGILL